jgi:hypothetical protein
MRIYMPLAIELRQLINAYAHQRGISLRYRNIAIAINFTVTRTRHYATII